MPPVPNVQAQKATVGAAPPTQSNDGVLAILSTSSQGPLNQPGIYSQQGAIASTFGNGPLPEMGCIDVAVSGRPALLMRVTGSVAATYGTFTKTGTGTYTPTAGGTSPLEHYSVIVNWITGTTAIGVAGATYQYSVDCGGTFSTVQALGTSSSLVLPNTGITVNLGTGTIVAGDTLTFFPERQLMNNTDISAALPILGNTRLSWEMVYFDAQYTAGSDPVSIVDTWLAGLEKVGQFKIGFVNLRYMLEPTPTAETPATYSAAMLTIVAADVSNRMIVGADGGHMAQPLTGFNLKRATAFLCAVMCAMLTPSIGTDPAYVGGAGPVPGVSITVAGQPNDWDESNYGGTAGIFDPARITTLRSFAAGGPVGSFVTNANVLFSTGSPIVYVQILRCMNKACQIAWAIMNTQLGRGVNTVVNSQTGNTNIDPADAQDIEQLVNGPLASGLAGQVVAAQFAINRDDPLNMPATPVTATVGIVVKFYIKQVLITVAIVKAISAPAGGI